MTRKQFILLLLVVGVLGVLVYFQFRTWRRFDWQKFKEGTEGIRYWKVLAAVLLIYTADFLRAIRWKIFLLPTHPRASWTGLIAPQYVGFAGLALLGRPGELVRPYLIARKEGLTMSSQMAIWFVERVFDTGAVTLMLVVDIFLVHSIRDIEHYQAFQKAGYAISGVFVFLVLAVFLLLTFGSRLATVVCERISPWAPKLGSSLETRLRSFSGGLNTIKNVSSFFQLAIISLVIWVLVAFAYREVTHAYPMDSGLPDLELPEVMLLLGASVVGGVLQLPVVGGGSQLATIAVLDKVFDVGPELAVSCGILLWLVTFMSVAPLGLALARFEHISLRKLEKEAELERKEEERQRVVTPTATPT